MTTVTTTSIGGSTSTSIDTPTEALEHETLTELRSQFRSEQWASWIATVGRGRRLGRGR
jgi:hypothetical protein